MSKVLDQKVTTSSIENLDPKHFIIIKGARVNNLKNIELAIPRYKLVVVTGLSGSGKSSLAFDTLFAEGQRMYVESLSSYARQFLGRMQKPEVDYIKGVSPAIAIEQKVNTKNPRSTVGTTTEIYDYLKLLFARIGHTYSPVSGNNVKKDTVSDIVNYIESFEEGDKIILSTPLREREGRTRVESLKLLLHKGFARLMVAGEAVFIEEIVEKPKVVAKLKEVFILVDRIVLKKLDEEARHRLSDSIQTAFFEGEGECVVEVVGKEKRNFSDKFELDGISFEEPTSNFFSFNNPYGACKTCEGFGSVLGIDIDLVIPNKNFSIFEGAIAPWRSEKMQEWETPLIKNGIKFDFPIHRSYNELSEAEKELLWTGNKYFEGLNSFFKFLEGQAHKIQYRVMLSRYRGRTHCPDCRGSRLRKDASYVKINNYSITDIVLMPIEEAIKAVASIKLNEHDQKVADRILLEISNRLGYMSKVGLGYLSLNRLTSSLSGGEYQRIKLATSLGSALVGSMYILDEPSIGLHPRDTQKMVEVLLQLRDMGNTVIVVEHEEEVMRAADQIIDIGPDAGSHGGELMFQLNASELAIGQVHDQSKAIESHTYRYLNNIEIIDVPSIRRTWSEYIEIIGAREHNLKNVSVKFPLGVMTVVTGVSGSGKSTLVKKILSPALMKLLGMVGDFTGKFDSIGGNTHRITQVEYIDQNPIGKSSRSNPATYVKAYDLIRDLYAEQALSKTRGYKPGFFSFNVDGGRCEACQGEGETTVEMQFMADIKLKCDSCHGRRFKEELLEITYNGKAINEVLDMTITDSLEFFEGKPRIIEKLKPLEEVGLGYVRLGQSSSSLSGGEAQRVKLASFLNKTPNTTKDHLLFVFDEPTTGLHFHDIKKLLKALNALVEQGNTVLIIEHNMEVIKNADWIIDMGPEGGDRGGNICFEGTPEQMIKLEDNYTASFLKAKL